MRRRLSTVKIAIGAAFAVILGCEPIDPSAADGGTSSSSSTGGTSGTATTNGLVQLDADGLCTRLINECKQQALQQECINTFFPLRVTPACTKAIPAATCADLTSTASGLSTQCFPSCAAGTAPVCNGDGTITSCTATGNTHRKDCRDLCTATGFTAWTGSCGTTYAGEVATQSQCWCR